MAGRCVSAGGGEKGGQGAPIFPLHQLWLAERRRRPAAPQKTTPHCCGLQPDGESVSDLYDSKRLKVSQMDINQILSCMEGVAVLPSVSPTFDRETGEKA